MILNVRGDRRVRLRWPILDLVRNGRRLRRSRIELLAAIASPRVVGSYPTERLATIRAERRVHMGVLHHFGTTFFGIVFGISGMVLSYSQL